MLSFALLFSPNKVEKKFFLFCYKHAACFWVHYGRTFHLLSSNMPPQLLQVRKLSTSRENSWYSIFCMITILWCKLAWVFFFIPLIVSEKMLWRRAIILLVIFIFANELIFFFTWSNFPANLWESWEDIWLTSSYKWLLQTSFQIFCPDNCVVWWSLA